MLEESKEFENLKLRFENKSRSRFLGSTQAKNMASSDHPVVREFRITVPMTLEKFRIGHLHTVAEFSKDECGGGEGVEIVINEPFQGFGESSLGASEVTMNGQTFSQGQFTHKVFHLTEKVPSMIRKLAPRGSLEVHEKSWNAFPFTHTEFSNPEYMKDNFYVIVDSFYAADSGSTENILDLTERDLSDRVIEKLDIANDKVSDLDYKAEFDPCLVGCSKTGRPPLTKDGTGDWMKSASPVMTCYKVVKVFFKWFGLQDKVQKLIIDATRRTFLNFHRRLVSTEDEYHNLTIEQIREMEAQLKLELDELRRSGGMRGMEFR